MKKRLSLLISLAAVFVMSVSMCGCAEEYKPSDDKNYFRDGEVYRVITLESDKTETIDEMPLYAYTPAFDADVVDTVGGDCVDATFAQKSMFFGADASLKINKDGVVAIFKELEIASYRTLDDDMYDCGCTGLYSFSSKRSGAVAPAIGFSLTGKTGKVAVCAVSEVNKYTIYYEDVAASDGAKVAEGSLVVYVTTDISYASVCSVG